GLGSTFVAIHLDYGLKKTTGYSPDTSLNALTCATPQTSVVPNGATYKFSASGPGSIGGSATVASCNDFKKTPGTAGIVINSISVNPVPGATAVLKDSKNTVLGTSVTDSDGWDVINYKWTGKDATFN